MAQFKWLTATLSAFISALLLTLSTASRAAEPPEFPLVCYYDYPPFMIESASPGLTHALARFLNSAAAGRYRLIPTYMPKGRLDMHLRNPRWAGAVVWLHPTFVHDEERKLYQWSPTLFSGIL